MPDDSTVCRRQKALHAQLRYRPSAELLQLLADNTGVKFFGGGEWKRKKHGAEYRRDWRKVHLGIDAQTLEIRAVEVTSTAMATRRCCRNYWRRFRRTKPWPASRQMVPMTRGRAGMRSRSAARWR
ncbi:MAG: hypothetical protein RLY78_2355 [Pseudomonadota bacterium]